MYCINCGNKTDKDNSFCSSCGKQIDDNITLIPYIEEQEITGKEESLFFLHIIWHSFIALIVLLLIFLFPITFIMCLTMPKMIFIIPFMLIFSILMLFILNKKNNISMYLNFIYIICNIITSLVGFIIPAMDMYNEIKLFGEYDSGNMFSLAHTYSNVSFTLNIGIIVLVISIIFFIYYCINGKKIFKSN